MERIFEASFADDRARRAAIVEWLARSADVLNDPAADLAGLQPPTQSVSWGAALRQRGLKTLGRWRVTEGDWEEMFPVLIADAAEGATAGEAALQRINVVAPGRFARVLHVGPSGGDALAIMGDPDVLWVFDPRRGLWKAPLAQARTWFAGYMREHFADREEAQRDVRVLELPVPVHITWVGPPNADLVTRTNKTLFGTDDPVQFRRDIKGATELAQHDLADGSPPIRVIFHCLDDHVAAFDNLLPNDVEVRGMMAQLGDAARGDRVNIDLGDIESSVKTLISRSVAEAEQLASAAGAGERAQRFRHLVNCKNAWSLYCLWRYGGYALDSVVLPQTSTTRLRFVTPKRFGAAQIRPGMDSNALHVRVTLPGGQGRLCMVSTLAEAYAATRLELYPPNEETPVTPVDGAYGNLKIPNIDVWCQRGPKGSPSVAAALEAMLDGWHRAHARYNETRAADPNGARGFFKLNSRGVVMSAALTGIRHPRPQRDGECQPFRQGDWAGGLIARDDPDLKLEKVGLRSHA